MADRTFFRDALARRVLQWFGRFATLAMIAVLAWLGARIFWSLEKPATPAPAMVVDTDALRVAESLAARHLFGETRALPVSVAEARVVADIKLQGVFAPAKPGSRAFAILSSQGKPAVAVREGEEFLPGVVLHRVLPRSVEIDRDGQIVPLSFPDPKKSIAPPALPGRTGQIPTKSRRRPTP
ncbi:MAG: hypothetical protein A3G25_06660 [Betaproteobacteria bacterium RIFCSPLOWO2_12_FULL_63_13]|nr:MAG: hypothetical protein A3H32_01090 [Betaproteobacteria bacterium RIFCSPLOWO2_02_FULL_63_19]OGA44499.1 MAG: hypothetical protein A3G25_06660 [Betaproteobacteria bacterium RIFCSPLOWO2_12_FULL_63_13]